MDQLEPSQQCLAALLGECPPLYLCIYVSKDVGRLSSVSRFFKTMSQNVNHILVALKGKVFMITAYRLGACGQASPLAAITTRMLSPKNYLNVSSDESLLTSDKYN